jgi:glycosyltransferase involved in cell wall biosynthesis
MKVLHAYKVYLPDSYGGIPSVIELIASLPRASFETFILVARRSGWGRRFNLGSAAVQAVGSLGTALSMPVAVTYPFVLAMRARAMDMVVCHAPFPLADIGILLGLPRRVPLIVHWHAEIIGRPVLSRLFAPLARRVLKRADRIVVSDAAMIAESPMLQSYTAKCTVVPYGCDSAYWAQLDVRQQAAVAAIRARWPRLVFAVGRLVSYKGYGALLKALQQIDAQGVIVGDGPLRGSLEQMAAELGIADRVMFLGALQRDQVKEYMHAARVLAFPSVTAAEAFGIVQLEAMSAGRPVVNTALPTAVPRVARDGKEGLTVQPDNAEALAEALCRLLDDKALAERLGAAGRLRARAEFDSALFLARTEALYSEAAKLRRSG